MADLAVEVALTNTVTPPDVNGRMLQDDLDDMLADLEDMMADAMEDVEDMMDDLDMDDWEDEWEEAWEDMEEMGASCMTTSAIAALAVTLAATI